MRGPPSLPNYAVMPQYPRHVQKSYARTLSEFNFVDYALIYLLSFILHSYQTPFRNSPYVSVFSSFQEDSVLLLPFLIFVLGTGNNISVSLWTLLY